MCTINSLLISGNVAKITEESFCLTYKEYYKAKDGSVSENVKGYKIFADKDILGKLEDGKYMTVECRYDNDTLYAKNVA